MKLTENQINKIDSIENEYISDLFTRLIERESISVTRSYFDRRYRYYNPIGNPIKQLVKEARKLKFHVLENSNTLIISRSPTIEYIC